MQTNWALPATSFNSEWNDGTILLKKTLPFNAKRL